MIRLIKQFLPVKKIREICDKYLNKGAEAIIMGCTEIEILMKNENIRKINVMDILVDSVISRIDSLNGVIK